MMNQTYSLRIPYLQWVEIFIFPYYVATILFTVFCNESFCSRMINWKKDVNGMINSKVVNR